MPLYVAPHGAEWKVYNMNYVHLNDVHIRR